MSFIGCFFVFFRVDLDFELGFVLVKVEYYIVWEGVVYLFIKFLGRDFLEVFKIFYVMKGWLVKWLMNLFRVIVNFWLLVGGFLIYVFLYENFNNENVVE